MKKSCSLLFCTFLFLVFFLSSCDQDQMQTLEFKEKTYKNGEEILWIPSGGECIDSVVYFLDDTKIYKAENMPFVLKYKLNNVSSGKHNLNNRIYINGNISSYGTMNITVE